MSLPDFANSNIIHHPVTTTSVLVVEDEPFIAMDIEDVLRGAGFTPEVRSSRADALKWLKGQTPVAAILDLHLRDGDGLAIAEVLECRGVPVIICSGGDPEGLPEDFKVAAWVCKPFVEGDLVAAVKQAIETRDLRLEMEERA